MSGLITVIGQNAQMMLNLGTELLLAVGDAIMQCAQDGTLDEAGEALISGMWDAAIAVATSLGKALFGAIISGFNLENKMYTPENNSKSFLEQLLPHKIFHYRRGFLLSVAVALVAG